MLNEENTENNVIMPNELFKKFKGGIFRTGVQMNSAAKKAGVDMTTTGGNVMTGGSLMFMAKKGTMDVEKMLKFLNGTFRFLHGLFNTDNLKKMSDEDVDRLRSKIPNYDYFRYEPAGWSPEKEKAPENTDLDGNENTGDSSPETSDGNLNENKTNIVNESNDMKTDNTENETLEESKNDKYAKLGIGLEIIKKEDITGDLIGNGLDFAKLDDIDAKYVMIRVKEGQLLSLGNINGYEFFAVKGMEVEEKKDDEKDGTKKEEKKSDDGKKEENTDKKDDEKKNEKKDEKKEDEKSEKEEKKDDEKSDKKDEKKDDDKGEKKDDEKKENPFAKKDDDEKKEDK